MQQTINWVLKQTLLWKIWMQLSFRKRGLQVVDLSSEIAWDIEVEPPVRLGRVTVRDHVKIGKQSYVSSGMVFRNVSIGRYCSIGYNVLIGPEEHPTQYLTTRSFGKNDDYYQEMHSKKTKIGNDVWIGANVIVRRGVTIADGAVVGAGAVVLTDVPAYAVVVGVPAKIVRYRFNEETIRKLLELKWWEIDETALGQLDFSNINECIATMEQLRRQFIHSEKRTT